MRIHPSGTHEVNDVRAVWLDGWYALHSRPLGSKCHTFCCCGEEINRAERASSEPSTVL